MLSLWGFKPKKKLLGKMASKKIAKVFIDDTSARLLDNLYKLSREYSGSKKVAEKLTKDLIKTVIKVGILHRNEQFNSDELHLVEKFKKKFQTVAKTVVSFYEVDFSFDRNFLSKGVLECSVMLKQLVERHLTEKSLTRIDNVFMFYGNAGFLEVIFKPGGQHKDTLKCIVEDVNKLMENGTL